MSRPYPDITSLSEYHVPACREREFSIENLLVRIHQIFVMIKWTGPAPWTVEFSFPGNLTSTFLQGEHTLVGQAQGHAVCVACLRAMPSVLNSSRPEFDSSNPEKWWVRGRVNTHSLAKLGKLLKWAADAHVVSEVPVLLCLDYFLLCLDYFCLK